MANKNGHNLSISRYVSTGEPEEEIELADMHRERRLTKLTSLSKQIFNAEIPLPIAR